jgi:hypothetical protein
MDLAIPRKAVYSILQLQRSPEGTTETCLNDSRPRVPGTPSLLGCFRGLDRNLEGILHVSVALREIGWVFSDAKIDLGVNSVKVPVNPVDLKHPGKACGLLVEGNLQEKFRRPGGYLWEVTGWRISKPR